MTRRFALLATLNLAFLATGALAEPWVKKYDPPASYSPEKPAFAFFKEITVTRKSSRALDFDITLQGPIPKNMPKDYGVNYYVYFDIADIETGAARREKGDFKTDTYVSIFLTPNSPSSRDFKTTTIDVLFRSKKWIFEVGNVRVSDDKLSFNVTSNLFSEKDVPLRMRLVGSTTFWEGGNTSKHNQKINEGAQYTEPFDLPTKSSP